MSQFALPLAWPPDPAGDQFLVTPSNARAAQQMERWGTWSLPVAVLTGPRKSGRSLLARIFAAKSGGTIIDEAERQQETEVFHAWNRATEQRRPLVIVADAGEPGWTPRLPDLRSRLAASTAIAIGPPDGELMAALLAQQLQRRGLDARSDVLDWAAARLERSHVAVLRAVDVLDQAALERRRRVTIPLARIALADAGLIEVTPTGEYP